MQIYIERYGCTRRNAELSKFNRFFRLNGFDILDSPEKADYCLLSTCAFKKKEEEHSINRIDELLKYDAKLIVYGCLPDISPSKFKKYSEVLCLAPKDVDKIDSFFQNISIKYSDIDDSYMISDHIQPVSLKKAFGKFIDDFEISSSLYLRTVRYAKKRMNKMVGENNQYFYLFICKGCYGNCSYCAISRAIGSLSSQSTEVILNQLREGIRSGFQKYIILGDDVGAYGCDINSTLPDLLSRLIEVSQEESLKSVSLPGENGGINFYIEEIHPNWMIKYHKELLDILASRNIKSILCPVQSGSDRILKLMNRGHSHGKLLKILTGIRSIYPDINLSTQVIVGFPSEREDEFYASLEFIKKINFDSVTIFPYDEKENTPAAGMHDKVSEDVIRNRMDYAIKYFKRENIEAKLSCI